MDGNTVRQMVRDFREKTGATGGEEHCFAAWYLHQRYHLPDIEALQRSSDGSYDFGIDAFHIVTGNGKSTLILIQSKYSEGISLIRNGYRDFEKALEEVRRALHGIETEESIQNKVIVNLRAALNRLSAEERTSLEIEFQVLHLATEDEAILALKFQKEATKLAEIVEDVLEGRICHIRQVGPRNLGPQEIVVVPRVDVPLRLDGAHSFVAGSKGKMLVGFGRLADLVDLYRARRDDLFSRNVRYYLNSKKNTEKGPAAKMRTTLKQMCVDASLEPEQFALFHNGITIFARRADLQDGNVRVRDPYVLNGCQTIKNAFYFSEERHIRSRIKGELWQRVTVPVRIIETTDDALIRAVTVNNNRQNSMAASAFRANDPVQIRLEQRFKERRIVYERQEGAFDNIWSVRPESLEDEYANTRNTYVNIEDLARSIAAAAGEVSLALRANDIFESDSAYDRCFDETKRLNAIAFLTFLQNLSDVVGLVLKRDLGLNPKLAGGPKPSRFLYHTICLICRYLAKSGQPDFVAEWGQRLHYKDPAFREAIRRLLNSPKSGIRAEIARHFMTLESGETIEVNAAFDRCKAALKLKDGIDPFEAFKDVDAIAIDTPDTLAG